MCLGEQVTLEIHGMCPWIMEILHIVPETLLSPSHESWILSRGNVCPWQNKFWYNNVYKQHRAPEILHICQVSQYKSSCFSSVRREKWRQNLWLMRIQGNEAKWDLLLFIFAYENWFLFLELQFSVSFCPFQIGHETKCAFQNKMKKGFPPQTLFKGSANFRLTHQPFYLAQKADSFSPPVSSWKCFHGEPVQKQCLCSFQFQTATCLDTTTNDDYSTITTAICDAEFYPYFIIIKEDYIIFLSFPYKQTPLE